MPRFEYVPTNVEQNADTKVLNELTEYWMDCNNMGIKNQQWVREMILYGTGVLHVSWHDNKPKIENIPLRDFFVDPSATTMENAQYVGHRYLADKDDLRKMEVYDPVQDKMVPRYKNLDKAGEMPTTKDDSTSGSDKAFKEQFTGSPYGDQAYSKQIEVIRIYDVKNGRMIEIGNRTEFIYNEPTPYQRVGGEVEFEMEVDGQLQMGKKKLDDIDPFAPYAVLRGTIDTSLFYGAGQVEVILDRQETLNDWEAMDMDIASIIAMPMYTLDPQYADLAGEIEAIPGAVLPVPRNAISQMDRPSLGVDLESKKYQVQEQMRRATAADEVIQGSSQQKGRVTATEVQSQLNQASQRFSTFLTNLESEGYAQLAKIVFKMAQIFLTQEQAIRIVGPEGVEFKSYNPEEYDGEYDVNVKLETTLQKEELEHGQKMNQLYQMMVNNPVFDQVAINRYIIKQENPEISDEELNSLFAQPQMPAGAPPMAGMPMDGTQGQLPPENAPQGQEMPPELQGTALEGMTPEQINELAGQVALSGEVPPELQG